MPLKDYVPSFVTSASDYIKPWHDSLVTFLAPHSYAKHIRFLDKDGQWYMNYLLFNLEIWGLGNLLAMALPMFPAWAVMAMVGVLIGSLIQGYSKCPAQIGIAKDKELAATAGAVNGLMCCAAIEGLKLGASCFLGAGIAVATVASLLSNTLIMSFAMCKVESTVLETWGSQEAKVAYKEALPKKGSCCGGSKQR